MSTTWKWSDDDHRTRTATLPQFLQTLDKIELLSETLLPLYRRDRYCGPLLLARVWKIHWLLQLEVESRTGTEVAASVQRRCHLSIPIEVLANIDSFSHALRHQSADAFDLAAAQLFEFCERILEQDEWHARKEAEQDKLQQGTPQ